MQDGVALTESDVLDYVHTPLRDLPLTESIPGLCSRTPALCRTIYRAVKSPSP